jgi:DNA-directed RNA polymerase subunit beta'
MRKAAASVLQLTEKDLTQIAEGTKGVVDGVVTDVSAKGALVGGEAIKSLLAKVDVKAALKAVNHQYAATKSVTKKDQLAKRRRYLAALDSLGLNPADAYTMKHVPVIPAKFRAVYPLPDGSLNVSDPIHGYREVLMVGNALRNVKNIGVDRDLLVNLRRDMNGAVAGLVGTQEPLTRSAHFKGFLAAIKGASNKHGFFQGRVMSRPQDLSGRSTIIPDPKLGVDEVGIPEKMALTVYKPFVVKRLIGQGYKPLDARDLVESGSPTAIEALRAEIKDRPVVLNRAPSLHKFNVLGFKPSLVQGEAIRINPLVVSGYNADFDGDTMGVHVPVTEESRREVFTKMLPSKNLFSPANDRVVNQPTMEMILGLYLMSKPVGEPKKAASTAEIVREYMAKKTQINTAYTVGGTVTCPGQVILNAALPAYARFEGPMTKKVMTNTIETVARREPKLAPEVLNKLKDLGNHYVTEVGFSVSLRDLSIDTKKRDAILDEAVKRTKQVGFAKASEDAAKQISSMVHADHDNRFVVMSTGSGALGGKAGSVNRLIATSVAVTDHRGAPIPVQIRKSYAEGHDIGSYWATLPGARKGMMDKGLSTADTGYLTKRLVQANIDTVISEEDCHTTTGIMLPASSRDIIGRYVANDKLMGKLAGKLVTPEIARNLKDKEINVRSPLTCKASRGLCAKCFGLNENGQLYPVGFHVGVLAAQTIGEPSTQLSLKAFHVGGAIGQGSTNKGFHRVDQLFSLPDNVKGKSILSAETGVVKSVEKTPIGGWNVFVDKTKHYVPHEVGLKVKVGDTVKAGDQISAHGTVRPQDVLETTGSIHAVRNTLISELADNFESSGVNIKRRIFETVVKPMTRYAKITDAAGSREFHAGDIATVDAIEEHNKTLTADKHVHFEPLLVGVGKVPHLGGDFIGRMMHDRIIETAQEAASLGRRSNIGPAGHPVARLAFEGSRGVGSPMGIQKKKAK